MDYDIVHKLRNAVDLKLQAWQDLCEDAADEIVTLRRRVVEAQRRTASERAVMAEATVSELQHRLAMVRYAAEKLIGTPTDEPRQLELQRQLDKIDGNN